MRHEYKKNVLIVLDALMFLLHSISKKSILIIIFACQVERKTLLIRTKKYPILSQKNTL